MNYYNEFDPHAAQWLRELIKMGLIPNGDVDDRSIIDVKPDELVGYTQCHFFAGIGGWAYALELANINSDTPLWTASLPCQPFSAAGLQKGKEDERHLLPHFLELVRQCKPNSIFGEQVESAVGHGWLDDLQTAMEGEGYSVGYCVLGAHSVNSPHKRQRLYWVANSSSKGLEGHRELREQQISQGWEGAQRCNSTSSNDDGSCISDTTITGLQRHRGFEQFQSSSYQWKRENDTGANCIKNNIWDKPEWIYCRDNKYRPIKPSITPLAYGIPRGMVYSRNPSEQINSTQEARKMRLKGYGNAIVPQVAAIFISAFYEVINNV